MLLENCDLPKHTLEIRTHQHLPDCHQTVQEVLGHLSEYQLCMQFHPTHRHSYQRSSQRLLRSCHRHHPHTQQSVDPCHSRNCIFNASGSLGELRQVKIINNCYNSFRFPLAASAASHHCVQKASRNAFTFSACRATRGQYG